MEQEKTRMEEIHEKGFDMLNYANSKMKVGVKTLDDATLDLGYLKKFDNERFNKGTIVKALLDKDVEKLRLISSTFFISNGIYQRACKYAANLYRYDWYVVSEIKDKEKAKKEKVTTEFNKVLRYLDNSYIKNLCGDIATQVIVNGAYYGYQVENAESFQIQELPINYCRSRYKVNGKPAVEFDMRFFDDKFPDTNYRERVINMFPKDFQRGYRLYKQHKLQPDYLEDSHGWYLLDINKTMKFSLNADDIPLFVNAIPAILDLDAAQDLDRRKQMQKLLKIIIQKLPMDKNGDLIFDVDEARDIHNNAVQMLRRAIGVDVLTTFADIDSVDMSDKNTTTSTDDLKKVERTVFNNMGISQNLFNTDGNMSLEKSILNDEGALRGLLLQFTAFFDRLTQGLSTSSKNWDFRFYMLETTQYNYKDLSKMYKEQSQMGYPRMLPQIALGHSQSSILNSIYFENEILDLSSLMIPPLMSSSIGSEDIIALKGEDKETGRPELPDDQKSDKTIQNLEAMS